VDIETLERALLRGSWGQSGMPLGSRTAPPWPRKSWAGFMRCASLSTWPGGSGHLCGDFWCYRAMLL